MGFNVRKKVNSMMLVLSVLLGSLEVVLVTWLVLVISHGGGLWFIAGLIAYFAWSFYVGGTLKSIAMMLASASLLAWFYLSFGIVAAVAAYVGFIVLGELLSLGKPKPDALAE
jgi:hypothetical protein